MRKEVADLDREIFRGMNDSPGAVRQAVKAFEACSNLSGMKSGGGHEKNRPYSRSWRGYTHEV